MRKVLLALVALIGAASLIGAVPAEHYISKPKPAEHYISAPVQLTPAAFSVPRPATTPSGGANVRNVGNYLFYVNGRVVYPGFTSWQSGVSNATYVQAPNQNGRRDLRAWRLIDHVWYGGTCHLGGAGSGAAWSIGIGDFAFMATDCGLG